MVGLSPFHLEPAPFSIKIPRTPSISLNLSKIRTFFFFLLSSAPGDPHSSSPDVHGHSAVAEVHSEVAEGDMEPSKGASFTHHHIWWFLSVVSGEAEGGRGERSCIKPQDNQAWKLFFHWFSKINFSFFTNSNFGNICPPPQGHMLGFNAFMEQRLGSRSPSPKKSNRRPTWGVQSPT